MQLFNGATGLDTIIRITCSGRI